MTKEYYSTLFVSDSFIFGELSVTLLFKSLSIIAQIINHINTNVNNTLQFYTFFSWTDCDNFHHTRIKYGVLMLVSS